MDAPAAPAPRLTARYRWVAPPAVSLPDELQVAGGTRGLSPRLLRVVAARGCRDASGLAALLDAPLEGLLDPGQLPDADRFAARIAHARRAGESVLVFGDFDADGVTGLAILVAALRRLGIRAEPYVPSRLEEGHGLSLPAVERARAGGFAAIVTVDCGTSSVAEVDAANRAGIDVLITDHHRPPAVLPAAAAIVNPHLRASRYPHPWLAGSGVAFKLAQLLLADEPGGPDAALHLADLAAIGTIADLAPVEGENRCIVRLGLALLQTAPRPGLRALLDAAGVDSARIDRQAIGFAIAPRLNAAGRIGDATDAARLLLSEDAEEAAALALGLEAVNTTRRALMSEAVAEARAALEHSPSAAVTVVAGPWQVGIVGLVASRLAEERNLPAVVFSTLAEPWRGSARSARGFDLAAAFTACAPHFERFGGHAGAAGCSLRSAEFERFRDRIERLAAAFRPAEEDGPAEPEGDERAPLRLDLALRAEHVDYPLLRELARLEPAAEAPAVLGIAGLTVLRARAVAGGHAQLTVRKGREVLDGVAFGRPELAEQIREGDRVDVVARLTSRTFGGFESLQLEIRDVAPAGSLAAVVRRASAVPAPAVSVLDETPTASIASMPA